MKIVFWSHVRGQCGATMHMTSIAVAQALFDDTRVVVMENHDHLINIETCLVGRHRKDDCLCERGDYNQFGLENLMERFVDISPEEEINLIKRCGKSFVNERLYYLPHGYLKNRDLLDYEFSNHMVYLFNGLEKHFDNVYVDAFATEWLSTKSILESADIVVVNLNQNRSVLDHFFQNFSSLRQKAIFVLGNYTSARSNTLNEIRKRYMIAPDKIYAVPYCVEAAESEADGSIVSFIARNYINPSIDNKEFINGIKDISNHLQSLSRH